MQRNEFEKDVFCLIRIKRARTSENDVKTFNYIVVFSSRLKKKKNKKL